MNNKTMTDRLPGLGADLVASRLLLGNVELAALDTELAYRGPERRSGPAASLAQLLACVLDEVDYGLLLIAADGRAAREPTCRIDLTDGHQAGGMRAICGKT